MNTQSSAKEAKVSSAAEWLSDSLIWTLRPCGCPC